MEMHRPSWDHVLKSRVTWIVFLRKELSYSVGCSFLFITLFIQRLSCFSWSLFRSKPVMISLLCPFFTHFSSLVLTLQKHEKNVINYEKQHQESRKLFMPWMISILMTTIFDVFVCVSIIALEHTVSLEYHLPNIFCIHHVCTCPPFQFF